MNRTMTEYVDYSHPLMLHLSNRAAPPILPRSSIFSHPLLKRIYSYNCGVNEHNFLLESFLALTSFCNISFRGNSLRMLKTFDVDRDLALNFTEFQNLISTLDSPLSNLTQPQIAFLFNAICQNQKLTNNVLTSWFSNMRSKSTRKQMAYPEPFLPQVESVDFKQESIADDCVLLEHLQNYVKSHGIHHIERALKFYANLYNENDQVCLSWNSLVSVLRKDFGLCFDDFSLNSFKASLFNHLLFTPVISEEKHLQSLFIPLTPFLHYVTHKLPPQKQGGILKAELCLIQQGKEAVAIKIKRVVERLGDANVVMENVVRDAFVSEFRSLYPALLDQLLDSIPFSNPPPSSPWRLYEKLDIEAYLRNVLFESPQFIPTFPSREPVSQISQKEYPQIQSIKPWQMKKKGTAVSASDLLKKLYKVIKKQSGKVKAIECSKYLREIIESKDLAQSGQVRLMDLIELFYLHFSQEFQDIEFTSLFLYFRRMAGCLINQENFISYPFLLHSIEQSFALFGADEEQRSK